MKGENEGPFSKKRLLPWEPHFQEALTFCGLDSYQSEFISRPIKSEWRSTCNCECWNRVIMGGRTGLSGGQGNLQGQRTSERNPPLGFCSEVPDMQLLTARLHSETSVWNYRVPDAHTLLMRRWVRNRLPCHEVPLWERPGWPRTWPREGSSFPLSASWFMLLGVHSPMQSEPAKLWEAALRSL